MQHPRIIIIGGGIGGLATAIALNRVGLTAQVYEKEKRFAPAGAGLGLWANATGILQQFGLLETLKARGTILHQIKTSTASGKYLNTVRLKKLEEKFHFPSMVLLRSDLQETLLNAVPEAQLHFGKHCIRVEQKDDKVQAHFEDGTVETADALLFADGVHSIGRKANFHIPPLKYAGRISWRGLAQFDHPFLPQDTSFEIFGKGKRIGIFPLPGNKAYWYAAVNMPEEKIAQQQNTRESLLSHFINWAEPVPTLFASTPEDHLILTKLQYSFDRHPLSGTSIALLGDAAHPMTPDLGQGACQAIEDAYVLAGCFAQEDSVAASLKRYEEIRLKRVRSVARNSYHTGNLRQMENPVLLAVRNALLKILPERFALKLLERNIDRH